MPHPLQAEGGADSGLECLLLLARYFGVAASGDVLRHELGESGRHFDEPRLLHAARHLGLKARASASRWERLAQMALPAIACRRDGRFAVLAKCDGERVLVQDPAEPHPLVLPREVFEQGWSGRLILLTRRETAGTLSQRFDFTWFIPAIVKHRRLLGEVLLASFFIQLFTVMFLYSPLLTRVVIGILPLYAALSVVTTSPWPTRACPASGSSRRPSSRAPTRSSSSWRRATTASSASTAPRYRAGSASASPLPGHW